MLRKLVATLAFLGLMAPMVMAQPPQTLTMYWNKMCGFSAAADQVRRVAVSPDGQTIAAVRTNTARVELWDARSGIAWDKTAESGPTGIGFLNTTGVSGGTFATSGGGFTADGAFVACNLVTNNTTPLKVYIWDTLTTSPRTILNEVISTSARTGDGLAVIGSLSDNSAKIYVCGNNAGAKVVVLTTADNGRTWSSYVTPNSVHAQNLSPASDGTFWGARYAAGLGFQRYNADGSVAGAVPPNKIAYAGSAGGIYYDEAADLLYAMGIRLDTLKVFQVSTGALVATATENQIAGGFTTGTANGSSSVVKLADGSVIAASERNGLARYRLAYSILANGVGHVANTTDTIQAAITAYNVGGPLAAYKPLLIQCDPTVTFDESISLNDGVGFNGAIAGDLIIRSAVPGTKAAIALRKGPSSADAIWIAQNTANVVFKDLLLYPSLQAPLYTGTGAMIRMDQNTPESVLNWVELYNIVQTDIAVGGAPMVTSKAEAIAAVAAGAPPASGSTLSNGAHHISHYTDANESMCLLVDNCVSYASKGFGYRAYQYGVAGESLKVNNCLVAWTTPAMVPGSYAAIRMASTATGAAKFVTITGDDAGAGPANCTALIEPNYHAFYNSTTAAKYIQKFSNVMVYFSRSGGTPSRAMSTSSGCSTPMISDCIFNVAANANIVTQFVGAAVGSAPYVWERNTLHQTISGNAILATAKGTQWPEAQSVTLRDSIFSGPGTKIAIGTNATSIDAVNCAFVTQGPNAIGATGVLTTNVNSIPYDPIYADPTVSSSAAFMDVRSPLYAGKSSTAGNLAGGADYLGDASPAVCSVDPISHDFGSLTVGDPATTFTFVVGNTGGQTMYITGNTINGSADFTVLKGLAASLAVGSTDTLAILYTPNSKGLQTANVEIAASILGSPKLVPVQGTGLAPTINVPVASHNFGNQVLGSPALFQSFYVENTGTLDLVIGIPGIVGSADFAVDSAPTTIAAGTSDTLVVKYTPTLSGAQTATISIPSNDPANPSVDIVVNGFGSLSDVAVIGAHPVLGAWTPANAANMNDLGILGDAVASDSIYTLEADVVTTPSVWKVLKDKNLGWGGGNDVGRQADGGDMPDGGTSGTITYFYDTRDLTADGWMPATEGLGSTALSNIPWVAVGSFQEAAGGANWDADSAVTAMRDDGLNGDAVAGDGVFTFQFQPATALTDAQWLVVSNLGSGWGGEYKFGSNGMAQDPGGVTQPQFSADRATEITMEYDAWLGHIRLTIVTKPPLAVHDWAMY